MKARTSTLLGISLLVLAGCEKDQPPATPFTVSTDDQRISAASQAIRQACPGLDKYASQLTQPRVQQNFRTAIVFDIPDDARLPEAYKAAGHTCYLEIDARGQTLFIDKLPCKSICLDQVVTPPGQLKLSLTGART